MKLYDGKEEAYRAIKFCICLKPETLYGWVKFLWGWDIWFGSVPFLKSLTFINLISIYLMRHIL